MTTAATRDLNDPATLTKDGWLNVFWKGGLWDYETSKDLARIMTAALRQRTIRSRKNREAR